MSISLHFFLSVLSQFSFQIWIFYAYGIHTFFSFKQDKDNRVFCMRINKLLTHMGSLHEYDLLWTQVHSSILFSWSRVYTSYDRVRQPKMMWALCCFTSIYKRTWWVEHEIKFEMQERRRIITHPSKNWYFQIDISYCYSFLSNLSTIEERK